MEKYYYCIDVGGTDIKGGIVDENYKILSQEQISSCRGQHKDISELILTILNKLENKSGLSTSNASGLGIGLPGLVDSKTGIIKDIPNLKIGEYDIVNKLKQSLNIPIKIANDAELALLAEQQLGAGKDYNNFALLTLGTGLGLGLVINGKNLRSTLPYSCEIGHNLLNKNSSTSLEEQVSTSALVNQTKTAMQKNPNSLMWTKYNLDSANGKTVFDFMDSDQTARNVFNDFIQNLGTCVVNLYNIFTPDIIILGGGISKQGTRLTEPLEKFVNDNIFLNVIGTKIKIVPAKFLNDAGILGARCLFN